MKTIIMPDKNLNSWLVIIKKEIRLSITKKVFEYFGYAVEKNMRAISNDPRKTTRSAKT